MMDDQQHSPSIGLSSHDRQQGLYLSAGPEEHHIQLKNQTGDCHLKAGKASLVKTWQDCRHEIGGEQRIEVSGRQQLSTKSGDIKLQARKAMHHRAGQAMKFDTEKGDIRIKSGRDVFIEAGESIHLNARTEDLQFDVNQGSLSLSAQQGIEIHSLSGDITLMQAGAKIQISAEGNILIQGNKVHFEADEITTQGSQTQLAAIV